MNYELETMPKIHLHCHLDGAVTLPIMRELLELSEIPFEEDIRHMRELRDEELSNLIMAGPECRSLPDFLSCFDPVLKVLQTPEQIRYCAREVIRNAKAEGVIYLEIRFAPLLHCRGNLSPEEVVESFLKGMREGELKEGVITRGILIAMRDDTQEKALEVLSLAEKYRNEGIVGIDIAGNEAPFPPKKFAVLWEEANKKRIPFTIHAGECTDASYVKQALEFGADRIGHGIRAIEDGDLQMELARKKICLEICPTSNLVTASARNYLEIGIRRFMNLQIPVSVSTDDPGIIGTDLRREYKILETEFGFGAWEFRYITDSAIESCFAGEEIKKILREKVCKYWG